MDMLHFMTDAERSQLREFVARGDLPASLWLSAILEGNPPSDDRARLAGAIFFAVLPPESWGAPMNIVRWHRAGGTRGERAPALN